MSDGSGLTFVPPLLLFQAPVTALTDPVTSHLLIPQGAIALSDPEHCGGPGGLAAPDHVGEMGGRLQTGRQTDRQTRRVATAIAVSLRVYSRSSRRRIESGSGFIRPAGLHHRTTSSLDLAPRGHRVLDSVQWFLPRLGDDGAICHHSAKGTTDIPG